MQTFFAFQQVFQACTRFVLTSSPAYRSRHQADQRDGMEGAFKERDIAQQTAHARRRILFRAAVVSQQHNGQVRPGGLLTQQVEQRRDVNGTQRFVGNNCKAGTGFQFRDQLIEVACNDSRIAGFLENHQGNLAVPSTGRQNDRPF